MKKKYMTLLGACGLAAVLGATSYAAGGIEKIEAYLNPDIKITLDNEAWTAKDGEGKALAPVIIDGTSYVPAKAVVEAMGGQVQWNNDTKTIVITSVPAKETPVTPPQSGQTDRDKQIAQKIAEIKEKLKPGLTREEVAAKLQVKLEDADDYGDSENGSDSFSKVAYFKEAGYERPEGTPDHVIDYEGLNNKKVGANLFIGWKNDKLHFYSISYVNPADKKVHLFVVGLDGTSDDSPATN
ncbi:stalk domain-containing protein [Paenibacillus chitinolyticus]|uniref:stalk domain-containing protein n=1 Tax=Paenibacillus chitinolyticus TaxID=79263 RepID=UPI002DB7774C|nr:stalk domain-containing protein [Paenibacillus chitinolyticus]MEC0245278.1 stalk domain-containing protein [Paenibacillus chitinolyticus]